MLRGKLVVKLEKFRIRSKTRTFIAELSPILLRIRLDP